VNTNVIGLKWLYIPKFNSDKELADKKARIIVQYFCSDSGSGFWRYIYNNSETWIFLSATCYCYIFESLLVVAWFCSGIFE